MEMIYLHTYELSNIKLGHHEGIYSINLYHNTPPSLFTGLKIWQKCSNKTYWSGSRVCVWARSRLPVFGIKQGELSRKELWGNASQRDSDTVGCFHISIKIMYESVVCRVLLMEESNFSSWVHKLSGCFSKGIIHIQSCFKLSKKD